MFSRLRSSLPKSLGLGAARRRVPMVHQLGRVDCGAACLTMVLRFHRHYTTFEEVRQVVGAGARGTNLTAVIDAARYFGLDAEPVAARPHEVALLPQGAILHWDNEHFVVLERWSRRIICVMDPAFGRRRISVENFNERFSGTALISTPAAGFRRVERGESSLRRFGREVLRLARNPVSKLIAMSFASQSIGLIGPYLTGVVIDRVVPRRDFTLMSVVALGFAGFVAFQAVAAFIRSRLLLRLRIDVDRALTTRFMTHLAALPLAFFQRHTTGDLLMRVYSNASLRGAVTSGLLSGFIDAVMVTIYLAVLLHASGRLAVLVIAIAAVQIAVLVAARRRRAEFVAETLRIQAQAQHHDVEMMIAIETLKAMGAEDRATRRWTTHYMNVQNLSERQARFDSWVDTVQTAIRSAGPLLLLGFGAAQVMEARLSLGQMFTLNAIAAGFLAPLTGLAGMIAGLQGVGHQLERLDDVLSTAPEATGFGSRRLPSLSGAVQMANVSFRYGPLTPMVIQDVSFAVRPGQFIAIVGRSGSGKSTLGRLLLGLYAPSTGRICFDGHDIRSLDIQWLRGRVGVVTQQPQLFGDTVAANIALSAPDITRDDVIEAAKRAQIHDDIAALPHGYDTVLGARGSSLSGGQQQRLALARALASRPKLLVLDEASSQLDAVTESLVWNSLANSGCTLIVIAHRLSAVVNADLILTMEQGRLVESGQHAELTRNGGAYAALTAAQHTYATSSR